MRKRWGSQIALILLILLFFTQCQRPINVLSRDKMLTVTKDMVLTEAYLRSNMQTDSVAALYYEGVLEHHGVSRAKYDSSLIWYGEYSHRLDKIYEDVEKMLTEQKIEIDTLYSDSLSMERIRFKPTESLWSGAHRLLFLNGRDTYYYKQSVTLADTFVAKDTLEWYAMLRPPSIPDSIMLRLNLLITDKEGHYYTRLRSSLMSDSLHTFRYVILFPDSLPTEATATLYMVLQKPKSQSVFIDHIRMQRLKYTEPEKVDSLQLIDEGVNSSEAPSKEVQDSNKGDHEVVPE